MRDTVVYRTPYTFCHAGAKRQKRNREHWEQVYIYDLLGIYIPFRLIDHDGLLAHNMFFNRSATVGEAPEAPKVRGPNEVLQKIKNVATFSRKISCKVP